MDKRKSYYIGEGEYVIYFKEPTRGRIAKFKGICENFNSAGLSAFWNKEDEEMLLIEYTDIVGLYPIEIELS
ncbi:hypothetical protein [Priestia megaterium]|uniref:hypothetical protein n=1 Tax=Priestia megaterium TaxID=1404 RepID=UPI003CC6BC49